MFNNMASNSATRGGQLIADSSRRELDAPPARSHVQPHLEHPPRFVAFASWSTFAVGLAVILGWVCDIEFLKSVVPSLVSMKFNTALAFIMIGGALGLITSDEPSAWQLLIARTAAIGAMLIGGITICEFLFDWNPGIDQFFVWDPADPKFFPGRPALATSLNFCLVGIGLLLLRSENRHLVKVVQAAAFVPFMIAALSLVGHLFGASMLHGKVYNLASMALHTGATFVVFTIGMLYARNDFGIMTPLRSEGAGGILARRMIPTVFIVSLIFGWLRLQGQRRELFPLEFALALHCVVSIAVFCMAVWWVSRLLDRADVKRLQAEAALEKNRTELAHVLRINTMGEMVAGIAHELNQPLAAIGNFARGTVRRLQTGQGDKDELIEAVQTIASESTRAAEIILSLKRYVQDCRPQRLPLDINQIVQNASRILAGEARQRSVRLTLRLDPALAKISADRIQIKQVIINLVCNGFDALDAVRGPKWVQVETKRAADGGIEVVVTDNGCGLPAEHRHRIFEAFFTTKPDGLGMGLAISRSIILAHDGSLWAEKRPQGGTIFSFTLPLQRSDNA